MPSERYLFIPFLRSKSQMGQTKNRSSKKSHKKDHRTIIIATNFVWEQLVTMTHLPSSRKTESSQVTARCYRLQLFETIRSRAFLLFSTFHKMYGCEGLVYCDRFLKFFV